MSPLHWGQYLARGVSAPLASGPVEEEDAKAQAIVQRLKEALRNEGLTPFAVEVVMSRVQVEGASPIAHACHVALIV